MTKKLLMLIIQYFHNKKKEMRGGTRQGSGAKPKYNQETKITTNS